MLDSLNHIHIWQVLRYYRNWAAATSVEYKRGIQQLACVFNNAEKFRK